MNIGSKGPTAKVENEMSLNPNMIEMLAREIRRDRLREAEKWRLIQELSSENKPADDQKQNKIFSFLKSLWPRILDSRFLIHSFRLPKPADKSKRL